MKTIVGSAIVAVILASSVSIAQQSPQPPVTPASSSDHTSSSAVPPCAGSAAPKPPKGWHFNIPPKLQQAIDKQRQQLAGKTGTTVPSTDDLKKQIEQPKPCSTTTAVATQKPQQ